MKQELIHQTRNIVEQEIIKSAKRWNLSVEEVLDKLPQIEVGENFGSYNWKKNVIYTRPEMGSICEESGHYVRANGRSYIGSEDISLSEAVISETIAELNRYAAGVGAVGQNFEIYRNRFSLEKSKSDKNLAYLKSFVSYTSKMQEVLKLLDDIESVEIPLLFRNEKVKLPKEIAIELVDDYNLFGSCMESIEGAWNSILEYLNLQLYLNSMRGILHEVYSHGINLHKEMIIRDPSIIYKTPEQVGEIIVTIINEKGIK
jgi:hypothetical protein